MKITQQDNTKQSVSYIYITRLRVGLGHLRSHKVDDNFRDTTHDNTKHVGSYIKFNLFIQIRIMKITQQDNTKQCGIIQP